MPHPLAPSTETAPDYALFHHAFDRPYQGLEFVTLIDTYPQLAGFPQACQSMMNGLAKQKPATLNDAMTILRGSSSRTYQNVRNREHGTDSDSSNRFGDPRKVEDRSSWNMNVIQRYWRLGETLMDRYRDDIAILSEKIMLRGLIEALHEEDPNNQSDELVALALREQELGDYKRVAVRDLDGITLPPHFTKIMPRPHSPQPILAGIDLLEVGSAEYEALEQKACDEYAIAIRTTNDTETRLQAAFKTYYALANLVPLRRGSSICAHAVLGHLLNEMGLDMPAQVPGKDLNTVALSESFSDFYQQCLDGTLLTNQIPPAELARLHHEAACVKEARIQAAQKGKILPWIVHDVHAADAQEDLQSTNPMARLKAFCHVPSPEEAPIRPVMFDDGTPGVMFKDAHGMLRAHECADFINWAQILSYLMTSAKKTLQPERHITPLEASIEALVLVPKQQYPLYFDIDGKQRHSNEVASFTAASLETLKIEEKSLLNQAKTRNLA